MIFQQETNPTGLEISTRRVRIGFDLDGVIAQHSLGGFWVWLRELKEKSLKKAHSSTYYYPSIFLERWVWMVIDWVKKPFSDNKKLAPLLVNKKDIQLYLVTGRFKFLEKLTKDWLKKHGLESFFYQILINTNDVDPTFFKASVIKDYGLNFFIDDDLEVINDLKKQTKAQLYWIVPPHKDKSENNDNQVKSCNNVLAVLEKIVKNSL